MNSNLAHSEPVQPVAVCPEHPESPSVAPCDRCGRFLCDACLASRTPPRCSACQAIARDPFGFLTQPFAIGTALSIGWKLFSRALPSLLPFALLVGIPSGLLTHAIESSGAEVRTSLQVGRFFDATVGLLFVGAALSVMVGIAEGAPRNFGAAFKEGFSAWPRMFGARFRSGLWILLFTLLLIVPGIMKAVSLAYVTEAAFREPNQDALENSKNLTDGRRWEVFGLLVLTGVIVFVASLPVGVIGTSLAESFPATNMGVNILIDVVVRVIEIFAFSVGLAGFYGLKHSKGYALS